MEKAEGAEQQLFLEAAVLGRVPELPPIEDHAQVRRPVKGRAGAEEFALAAGRGGAAGGP